MNVLVADRVEGHIDAARFLGHGVGVLVDGALVQGIDLGRLRLSPCRGYLAGNDVQRPKRAAGQEDPRALAGERSGDRTAH